uniref:Uncharacterized protein n=1 Tax=Oryza nivara TaxID=4536 RepID=A0A0E0G2T2_ORYNI
MEYIYEDGPAHSPISTRRAQPNLVLSPSLSFSNPSTASSLSRRRGAAEEDETMGGAGAAEDGRSARPTPSSPRILVPVVAREEVHPLDETFETSPVHQPRMELINCRSS